MKRILSALFCLFFLYGFSQHPSTDQRYNLVLDENFTAPGIDESIWAPYAGVDHATRYDTFNLDCEPPPERAYVPSYFPNPNVVLDKDSGYVKLIVKDTSMTGEYWCSYIDENKVTRYITHNFETEYTVGSLQSKKEYRYGYYEIRFKMPYDATKNRKNYNVFGPAFWMWGEGSGYRNEIDIFENNHDDNTIRYSNAVHNWAVGVNKHTNNNFVYNIPLGWHTAACNWEPNKVEFYFDGKLMRTVRETWATNMEPMNIIIGIASPSEPPDLPNYTLHSKRVQYPYVFTIDYVKIWQLKQGY